MQIKTDLKLVEVQGTQRLLLICKYLLPRNNFVLVIETSLQLYDRNNEI